MKNFHVITLERYADTSAYAKVEDGIYQKREGGKYVTAFSFDYEDADKGLEEQALDQLAHEYDCAMDSMPGDYPGGTVAVTGSLDACRSLIKELPGKASIFLGKPEQLWSFDGEKLGIRYDLVMYEKAETLAAMGDEAFGEGRYEEAFYHYRDATDRGYTGAEVQYRLGWCYSEGQGITADKVNAVVWLRKAAAQGHAGAQEILAKDPAAWAAIEQAAAAQAAAEQAAEAKAGKAWEWKRSGDDAMKRADYDEAFRCYSEAALLGDADAVNKIAFYWEKDNNERAFHWLTRAAEQGSADAQNKIGLYYAQGTGITKDREKAAYWYTKAAEQGSTLAQKRLRYLREEE